MCSLKLLKRIGLFNRQINTPLKLVKINVHIFRSCHGNASNWNLFDLVYNQHAWIWLRQQATAYRRLLPERQITNNACMFL